MSTRYSVGPKGRIYSHHDSYSSALTEKWGWLLILVVLGGGGMLGAAAVVKVIQAFGLLIPKWLVVNCGVASAAAAGFLAYRYWTFVLVGAATVVWLTFLYVGYSIFTFISGG